MKKPLTLLLLALAIPSATAFACSAPPEEQLTPATELVQRTATIVLARVIKAEAGDRGEVTYTFKTQKTLKGKPAETFTIDGWSMGSADDLDTFDNHSKEDFWKDGHGRCHNETDCQIHPTFAVGNTYLIFLEAPYHVKSFEYILRTHGGDKWLEWVEQQTKPAPAPAAKPPAAK